MFWFSLVSSAGILEGVLRDLAPPGDFPADLSLLALVVRGPGAAGGASCCREEAAEAAALVAVADAVALRCGFAGEGVALRGETIFEEARVGIRRYRLRSTCHGGNLGRGYEGTAMHQICVFRGHWLRSDLGYFERSVQNCDLRCGCGLFFFFASCAKIR